LVLAADQFIVSRSLPDNPDGKTIIAGYHWFTDWGRDTMISLPGLTLSTGRPEIARSILRTFAQYVSRGMLPNQFPDDGTPPADSEYNTVDATLWYFEAIRAYYDSTGDDRLLNELFPVLAEIVDWHRRGTRYNIHLDPQDGLIYAGQEGVQLTWMDGKVGDWVVTPRIGKPVEINALWYNALRTMAKFARQLKQPDREYEAMAESALKGFDRFWNPNLGYCFDVIDTPAGDDASLRPNQIFAVSLPQSPLNPTQQRSVVEACGRSLLTPYGLRSLSPDDPQYRGEYRGDSWHRDGAYHQGTVWGWLIGPFVLAHLRVFHDRDRARQLLEPLFYHLLDAGLGTISEIFDGNAPMKPKGCIAQAWSVAEFLRACLAADASRGGFCQQCWDIAI
jgi:predicted glycogen debranching enzyme